MVLLSMTTVSAGSCFIKFEYTAGGGNNVQEACLGNKASPSATNTCLSDGYSNTFVGYYQAGQPKHSFQWWNFTDTDCPETLTSVTNISMKATIWGYSVPTNSSLFILNTSFAGDGNWNSNGTNSWNGGEDYEGEWLGSFYQSTGGETNVTMDFSPLGINKFVEKYNSDRERVFVMMRNDTTQTLDGHTYMYPANQGSKSYEMTIQFSSIPTLDILSPDNNTLFNGGFNIVYLPDNSNACHLFENGQPKTSDYSINNGVNNTFSSVIGDDGIKEYEVRCDSGTNNVSDFVTVEFDIIQPLINFLNPFQNGSITTFENSISYQINVTDDNLYNSNVTVFKSFDFRDYNTLVYTPLDDPLTNTVYNYANTSKNGVYSGNMTQFRVDGRIGGGVSFDDTSEITIDDSDNSYFFGLDDSFTLSAWIKTTNTDTATQFIVSRQNAGNGYSLAMASNGILQFRHGSSSGNRFVIRTDDTFNDGEWYHVVCVSDGSNNAANQKIYVNGVEQDINIVTNNLNTPYTTIADFSIGNRQNDTLKFLGLIDEVYLFSDQLSSNDVSELYNSSLNSIIYESYVEDYNTTNVILSDSVNINNPDLYTTCVRSCDGHTKRKLSREFKRYNKNGNKLRVKNREIEFGGKDFESFDVVEEFDRISFDINMKRAGVLRITLPDTFKKVENTRFKGHFIDKDKSLWFDTEPYNMLSHSYENGKLIIRLNINKRSTRLRSVGELNCGTQCVMSDVDVMTSFKTARADIPDFAFATNVFTDVISFNFNVSQDSDLVLASSFNVQKFSGIGTNDVYGRVLIDDEVVNEELLRSVSGIGNVGSTGIGSTIVSLNQGEHNYTLQVRRTGTGGVFMTNNVIVALNLLSSHDTVIESETENFSTSFSNTDFSNIFSTFEDHSENTRHSHISKLTITKDGIGSETTDFFIKNLNLTGDESPVSSRYLSGISDIGSVLVGFVGDIVGEHTTSIQGRSRGGDTINVNGTIIEFSLGDDDGRIVKSFQASNDSSNVNSSLALGSGVHVLINESISMSNGSLMFISGILNVKSTSGEQDINLTVIGGSCDHTKLRTLSNNDDIGNVFLFDSCLMNFESDSISMVLEIDGGESVEVIDESLFGYESILLNTASIGVPPIPNDITSPLQNSLIGQTDVISWNEFFGSDTYDVMLYDNESEFLELLFDDVTNTSLDYNWSQQLTGYYVLDVESFNAAGGVNSSGSVSFLVDSTSPVVTLVSPLNDTNVSNGDISYTFELLELAESNSSCNLSIDGLVVKNDIFSGSGNFSLVYDTVNETNSNEERDLVWNVECVDSVGLYGVGDEFSLNVYQEIPFGFLKLGTCNSSTGGVLILGILLFTAIIFVLVGFVLRIGVIGFFGSLLLFVISLYLNACQPLFAYIMVLFSLFLLIWFVVGGLGFRMTVFDAFK